MARRLSLGIVALLLAVPVKASAFTYSTTEALQQSHRQVLTVDRGRLNKLAAPAWDGRQRRSNWCWAAVLQMLMNYDGLPVTQEQLVKMLFGRQVNEGANSLEMFAVLTSARWATEDGRKVRYVASRVPPDPRKIYMNIRGDRPLVANLKNDEHGGHAYLLYGVVLVNSPSLGARVESVLLKDPWPMSPSSQQMHWSEFVERHISIFQANPVLDP